MDSSGNDIATHYMPKVTLNNTIVNVDDWVEDTGAVDGYTFYYDIVNTNITQNDIVTCIIPQISAPIIENINMSSLCESYAGYVRIKAEYKPSFSFSIYYYALKTI